MDRRGMEGMRTSTTRTGTNVARLLPFLIFAAIGLFLLISNQDRSRPARDWRAWRPKSRARAGQRGRAHQHDDTALILRPGDVEGLRDAYSGAPLDASRPLVQCAKCQAFYQVARTTILQRDNAGRCASCGGRDFRAVVVVHD
jgi:DNA-directed RNA polymerase subunit RPC12/RpoP